MAQSFYSLSWESYENIMCSKFSTLQENGDFVDMTIAADGHLVKVHQLILGIASPYVKELLRSAPCQHPVIFLNNVNFSTLCSILQYVYTGEVAVSEEQLRPFFQAAKALQIQGIGSHDQNATEAKGTEVPSKEQRHQDTGQTLQTIQIQVLDDKNPHTTKLSVPISAKNIRMSSSSQKHDNYQDIHKEIVPSPVVSKPEKNLLPKECILNKDNGALEALDDNYQDDGTATVMAKCSRNNSVEDFQLSGLVDTSNRSLQNTNELQYTVSIRGSLQLVLNRYIYNLFSKSGGGKVRRWRCVDYKVQRCPACTVTSGDVVVKRVNMHNHPYHDKKILEKIKKKAVYTTIRSISHDSANL